MRSCSGSYLASQTINSKMLPTPKLLIKNHKPANKNEEFPYICQSDCAIGYIWQKKLKRCVKVVRDTEKLSSHTEATLECEKENARLVSISNCEQLKNLIQDLKMYWNTDFDKYWLGFYFGIDSPRGASSDQVRSFRVSFARVSY